MKVIAAVDIMEASVVRLVMGDPVNRITYSSNPIETAQKWEEAGADLIHAVDIDAALGRETNNAKIISEIIKSVQIPVQVAGGIRSVEALDEMLGPKKAAKARTWHSGSEGPRINKAASKKEVGKNCDIS